MRHAGAAFQLDADFGCWLWSGPIDHGGYGVHRGQRAHRWMYEQVKGLELDREVELDHFCRRRSCVRPEHLEPVRRSENQRRVTARNRREIDRCPEGHRLTPETSKATPEGGTVCILCSQV